MRKAISVMVLIFSHPLTLPAHHSVSANFDTSTVVEASGVVTELSWRNPHVRFQLTEQDADGTTRALTIEMTSLTNLRRSGLSGQLLEVGDSIRVAGMPGRWDGDSLVVRTTRLNWAHFDVVGVPQSEDSELLERFTPSEDGSRLDYELTVTDPVNFTEPVTLGKFWVWYPEMTVEPFECRV